MQGTPFFSARQATSVGEDPFRLKMEIVQKQVVDCICKMRFQRGKRRKKKPIFNENQCNNLRHAIVAKLAKFCCVEPYPSASSFGCLTTHNIKRRVCVVSQCMEELIDGEKISKQAVLHRAWKEVIRVIKEAEIFLETCCKQDWWKWALTMAVSGEAHAVHMHDLVWSILCLESSMEQDDGDVYDAVCCRRLGEFYAEMNSPLRIHAENADKKQLVRILKAIGTNHDKKNALKKLLLSNTEDENRARLAKFLADRLQRLPNFFTIDPRDLKHKAVPAAADDIKSSAATCENGCPRNSINEALWLGIRVAIAEISSEVCSNEASVLRELESPFVAQAFGVCMDGDHRYIVAETATTNLEKWIEEKHLSMPLHVMVDIMLQISRGMEYMHAQGIRHLDLRPCSILFEPSNVKDTRDEGHGRVKIFPNIMTKSKSSHDCCWMAPELLDAEESLPVDLSFKAHAYSFGMICFHILTGKKPLQDQGPILAPSCSCPSVLADFLAKCGHADPAQRPGFSESSAFLRYVKLVAMRIMDPQEPNSYLPFPKEFDKKLMETKATVLEDKLTMQEEGLIIRALDGDFPESFGTPDSYRDKGFHHHHHHHPSIPAYRFMLKNRGMFDSKQLLLNLPCYIKRYSYEEMHSTTSGNVHESGLGLLLKAILPADNTYATIKSIDKIFTQSLLNEITVLSQLHHPNIINLKGVCTGPSRYFLLYSYMALDSLDKRLFGSSQGQVLTWSIRKRIAMGVSRALAHIHTDCRNIILGLKVDTNSILLDERFTPKLCGFGGINLARRGTDEEGFIRQDEEAANVYSFGVLLMELLSGTRGTDIPYTDYYLLHETLHRCGSETALLNFVDDGLKGDLTQREAVNMIKLGLWCLMKDPLTRPTFSKILVVLEGLKAISLPALGHIEVLPPPLATHRSC